MDPNSSQVPSASPVPRILIAESNTSTVESLIHHIKDSRVDLDYEVCTSHDRAVIKLFRSPPPYQLVISSVHLAEMDDFLLIKHNRFLQPNVPFVITTGANEIKSSRRALKEGAFDLIATPLEPLQTADTIRLALWHSKLQTLIASREKMLERFRQHIADYPRHRREGEAFQRALAIVQETAAFTAQSVQRIEESIVCFSDFATKVAHHAKKRASERLDALRKSPLHVGP
jgi:DNA-binding NtrC family response regulator